jgi:L-asparaginase
MLYIVTGGTIDKRPHYLADGTFDNDSKDFGDTHLPEMLAKGRFIGPYTVRKLFMVDSLDMTDMHREDVATAAKETDEASIVITHGTDTMPETARYLKARKSLGGKTIVLTGAMLPYGVGEESDAMFNLGNAAAFAQALSAGVYVAMNGQAFDADNVAKDRAAGVFKAA